MTLALFFTYGTKYPKHLIILVDGDYGNIGSFGKEYSITEGAWHSKLAVTEQKELGFQWL